MAEYPAGEGNTVMAAGHLDIREDAVDRATIALEKLQSIVRAVGLDNQISPTRQMIGDLQPNAGIVFDYQNRQRRADTAMM